MSGFRLNCKSSRFPVIYGCVDVNRHIIVLFLSEIGKCALLDAKDPDLEISSLNSEACQNITYHGQGYSNRKHRL